MDDLYISEFIDLATNCNYQKTSMNMNISISSLSKHIARIEDEVGVQLFDRSTRTVKLNDYGKIFLNYAKKHLELQQEYKTAIQQRIQKENANLTIGFMPITQFYGVTDLICAFGKRYPDIYLNIDEKNHMSDFFKKDLCDYAFTDTPYISGINTSSILMQSDHMVAIFPCNHPLANREQITLSELKKERYIANGNSQNTLYRPTVAFSEMTQRAGFIPDTVCILSSFATIINMVANGYGYTVLNKKFIPPHLRDKIATVELDVPTEFNIYCLYRDDGPRSEYSEKFYKFVIDNMSLGK